MNKKKKILLWTSIIFTAAILGFILIYSYTSVVDKAILSLINSAVDHNIKIRYDRLEGNLLGKIRLKNVEVITGDDTLLCPEISLSYNIFDLTNGQISMNYLVLESPHAIIGMPTDSEIVAYPPAPGSPDTTFSGIDLSALPTIKCDKLAIHDGSVVIQKGGSRETIRDISLESRFNLGTKAVNFDLQTLQGLWVEKQFQLLNASFRLSGNQKRLTLNQLIASFNNANFTGHGEIDLKPKMQFLVFLDTSHVSLEFVKHFKPDLSFSSGNAQIFASFLGNPKSFNGELFISGIADSLSVDKCHFFYSYRNSMLTLKNLDLRSNFGSVYGRVTVSPESYNNIDVSFRNLNLHKIGLSPKSANLNGTLALKFQTWNIDKLTGQGTSLIYDLRYDNVQVDTVLLKMTADRGNWNLLKGSMVSLGQNSRLFLNGSLSRNHDFDVTFNTEKNNLDTLAKHLALGDLGGQGSLNVHLTGNIENPNITGYFLLDSLTAKQNVAYGVEGKFKVQGMFLHRMGSFSMDLYSGSFAGIPITDGAMNINIEHDTFKIDSLSFYNGENYITMSGNVQYGSLITRINLDQMHLQYENYQVSASDTLQATIQNDTLKIENFMLSAPQDGEIEIRGSIDFKQSIDMALFARNIKILPLNQFLKMENEISGLAECDVQFYGPMDSLEIETDLSVNDFKVDKNRIGDLSANVNYLSDSLRINRFTIKHDSISSVAITGGIKIPERDQKTGNLIVTNQNSIKLTVTFNKINLNDYPLFKNVTYPVSGIFDGDIDLSGTLLHPSGKYLLNGNDVKFREYSFPHFKLDGRITDDRLLLDFANINFMNTDILANGFLNIDWDVNHPEDVINDNQFSLQVKIQQDSINFINTLTPEVDLITGRIDFSSRIGGTLQNIAVEDGNINITDGTIYLSKLENPISNVEMKAVLKNDKLILESFKAKTLKETGSKNFFARVKDVILSPLRKLLYPRKKEGQLAVSGSIDLSELTRPRYDLTCQADNAYLNYFLENTELTVSTKNLRITGRDTMLVQGDVTINSANTELDLEESEKNYLLYPNVREKPPFMQYRLSVRIPGNFFVRSEATFNSFQMELAGDLQVLEEPRGLLEMYGYLDVTKGKYFQFEDFDIRSGRIEFQNPKELPELNLYAEKKNYGYIFELHVTGRLNNPQKEIQIIDASTNNDVTSLYPDTKDQIALLLFGTTFNELKGGTGNFLLGKGEDVLNQAILTQIEREARNFVGLDQIRFETQENLIDFRNRRLNQNLGESSLYLGKYLTPNVYLEYKTQLSAAGLPGVGEIPTPKLSWEAGNQIYLEYRLNRFWSISTLYGKTLENNDQVKIDVSWKYDF